MFGLNNAQIIGRLGADATIRAPDWGVAGPAHTPRSYPGDERRQLPSQPEPKTAETPKNLTTQPMVDPVG